MVGRVKTYWKTPETRRSWQFSHPSREYNLCIHIYIYIYTYLYTYIYTYIYTYNIHIYIHTYIYVYIYTYIMPRFFLVDQCWRYRIRKYYGYNMIQADSICTVNLSKLSNISRSFYGHVIGSREAPFCCSSQLRCPRCSVVFFVIQAFAGENTLVT